MCDLDDSILVTLEGFESPDPYRIIQDNIDAVCYLYDREVPFDKISSSALYSYYVDFYYAQVQNGGHSQFIWNSRWDDVIIEFLRRGLVEMNAKTQIEIFNACFKRVQLMGKKGLALYLSGEFDQIVELSALDDRTYEIREEDSLYAINSNWLKGNPNLVILSHAEWMGELRRRATLFGVATH